METNLSPLTKVYIGECRYRRMRIPVFFHYDGGYAISVDCSHASCKRRWDCRLYSEHLRDPRLSD